MNVVHSRGYLPHWELREVPQSITFRLANSLPSSLLKKWSKELINLQCDRISLERRKRIEAALDEGYGEPWLCHPEIGLLVEDTILHGDKSRYRLHEWVVMPNHVHVLATPLEGWTLTTILQGWKSVTARNANRILARSGRFWAPEYYDRAIRNEQHFLNVQSYIRMNPVKAGLCSSPELWRFSSAAKG